MKKIMYALLDAAKYVALNDTISNAMGFDVGKPTERYASVEPMLAKVNIIYNEEGNESFDTIPVMQITGFVQENYPNALVGVELVDGYIQYTPDVQL